jgi:hypothetical protein
MRAASAELRSLVQPDCFKAHEVTVTPPQGHAVVMVNKSTTPFVVIWVGDPDVAEASQTSSFVASEDILSKQVS